MQTLRNLSDYVRNVSKYNPLLHLHLFTCGSGHPTLGQIAHTDFAGPFQGKNILISIDAHSKWIEAVCTPSTASSCVIEELRTLFAKFGLPETIVTDNGTCFVSQE